MHSIMTLAPEAAVPLSGNPESALNILSEIANRRGCEK
ncbi:Uncharacterized protein dnm_006610 [Desulfonema magnum]|uniref:Uncharacterized protein n=1 Tax=Desulfonema magnum TaxID=45655 RepID=A0A975BFW3_9BACT|nr:Uncharacterized protein dnm_006610 [Desulfonema magnum]